MLAGELLGRRLPDDRRRRPDPPESGVRVQPGLRPAPLRTRTSAPSSSIAGSSTPWGPSRPIGRSSPGCTTSTCTGPTGSAAAGRTPPSAPRRCTEPPHEQTHATINAWTAAHLTEANRRALAARYDHEVAFADGAIGDLVARLRAAGVLDDTLLVVTADHGEGFFEHGSLMHGFEPYEEVSRVPLIVHPPRRLGLPAGVRSTPVSHVDFAPTLLDLLGLPPLAGASGRSYSKVLQATRSGDGRSPPGRDLERAPPGQSEGAPARPRSDRGVRPLARPGRAPRSRDRRLHGAVRRARRPARTAGARAGPAAPPRATAGSMPRRSGACERSAISDPAPDRLRTGRQADAPATAPGGVA